MSVVDKAVGKFGMLNFRLTLVIGAIVGAIYYFTFFDDGKKLEISTIENQKLIQKELEIQKKNNELLENEENLKKEIAILAERYQQAILQLPNETKEAEILKVVNAMSKAAGTRMSSLSFGKPEAKEIYEQIPVNINAIGTYAELTTFLMYVAKVKRIFHIKELRLEPENKQSKLLILKGVLVGYRFIEPKEKETKMKEEKPKRGGK